MPDNITTRPPKLWSVYPTKRRTFNGALVECWTIHCTDAKHEATHLPFVTRDRDKALLEATARNRRDGDTTPTGGLAVSTGTPQRGLASVWGAAGRLRRK